MEINSKYAQAEHGIVNRVTGSLFSYQGWPSVCRDENGVLYAVASGFRMQHVCPFGKTVMYISRDGGRTWTPPVVINDTFTDDRDAGILYLGEGRILVTWFCHATQKYVDMELGNKKPNSTWNTAEMKATAVKGMIETTMQLPESERGGGSYIRISEDYGVTWGETVKVDVSAPHGPVKLRDGSILYLGKEMYNENAKYNQTGSIRAMKSTDGGYTWCDLGALTIPEGTFNYNFHEPHAIELPDGRILGIIRAERNNVPFGFTMYKTESCDGGKSWSPMECMNICGAPPHLMLHSSGALICSYGRRAKPYGEHAIVSYDLGRTWSEDYTINDDVTENDLGYPCSVEMDDGSIMTVYYQRYKNDENTSILWSRWRLEEK